MPSPTPFDFDLSTWGTVPRTASFADDLGLSGLTVVDDDVHTLYIDLRKPEETYLSVRFSRDDDRVGCFDPETIRRAWLLGTTVLLKNGATDYERRGYENLRNERWINQEHRIVDFSEPVAG